MAKYLKPALTAPTGRSFYDGRPAGWHVRHQSAGTCRGYCQRPVWVDQDPEPGMGIGVLPRARSGPDIPTADAVRHIVAELYDPNRLVVEVAYGPAGRVTLVAQPADLNAVV